MKTSQIGTTFLLKVRSLGSKGVWFAIEEKKPVLKHEGKNARFTYYNEASHPRSLQQSVGHRPFFLRRYFRCGATRTENQPL